MLGTAEMSWSLRTCKTKRTVANSSTCKTRNVITKVRQDQKFCNSLNVVVWPILWVVTGCVIHLSFVSFFMSVYELVQRSDADRILKLNSVSIDSPNRKLGLWFFVWNRCPIAIFIMKLPVLYLQQFIFHVIYSILY